MKEKLKTAAIIILLITSLILIIGCRTNRFTIILPGYSPRSISIIHEQLMVKDWSTSIEEQQMADSIFYEKYELPLTR